ncbi:homocysteine S-methyltransferase [Kushneria phosphatilytica]|uniref:S-methylmethionine:homocysteine methyltransferase n=1 Tax=Kushneria phosphatilytica TaxID=657387 RepID=A0A5C1A5U5_9GAMM|nr:homocysteine S-methyltransferase [Kushneria phosphatilytica]QEL12499.1 homocysteine S-methyltransferase [Kushneria phosphatilytica]
MAQPPLPSALDDVLARFDFMVLDGALATELERTGFELNDALWSARLLHEAPEAIVRVHQAWFEAGADCAITASYQASVEGFRRYGMSEEEALALIRRSVQLACRAREAFWQMHADDSRPWPLVAASVGPYGATLADGSEYRGDYTDDEVVLQAFHRPRLAALLSERPDLLAIETLPSLSEARALIRLLPEFPEARAWVSFTARDAAHISDGTPMRECAALLSECPQVVAIGVNCTAPRHISGLIDEIRAVSERRVIVYPNSGERYDPQQGGWQPQESSDVGSSAFGDMIHQWRMAGAAIIGGCCRTTPRDIAAIAEQRRRLN